MRTWMVPPQIMCQQHLLGEHNEIHKFVGAALRGKNLVGYRTLVAADMLRWRHDQLVLEFARRGWPSGRNHRTPFSTDYKAPFTGQVDIVGSFVALMQRCSSCRYRAKQLLKTMPHKAQKKRNPIADMWNDKVVEIRNLLLS